MNNLKNKVKDAELVLIGIGERFTVKDNEQELIQAYKKLKELLADKNYFIITTCMDELLQKSGLREDRIVCPLLEEESEEGKTTRWERYMKWLQGTLNKKVLILELGVGMKFPSVIRWPFEKVAYFNQKAGFYRVNETLYQLTEELKEKGISIPKNSIDWLFGLC